MMIQRIQLYHSSVNSTLCIFPLEMFCKRLNCHIILCGTKTCTDVTEKEQKELETGSVSPAGCVAEISST